MYLFSQGVNMQPHITIFTLTLHILSTDNLKKRCRFTHIEK